MTKKDELGNIEITPGDATEETLALFAQLKKENPDYAAALQKSAERRASLQELRRKAGFTQAKVAEIDGRTQEAVSAFERHKNPRIDDVRKYVSQMGGQTVFLAIVDGEIHQLHFGNTKPEHAVIGATTELLKEGP